MSYHKERWIYIWPQSGPAPQFVMSQCLTSLPPLHPRPLWPRPDETGWKRCVQIWNMNAIKVLSNSALQPDKCAPRRSVPAQMSARYGPDVSVKSLFASPTSLSFLQNHRIYNQIKREISYLCSSSTTSFFSILHFSFILFLSFSHIHHRWVRKQKKKRKWRNQNFRSLVRFSSAGFPVDSFEPCWTAVRHNTVEMITEKQRKKNTKFKAWITDITSYNSVFGRIMEESIHPDSCAQPPFQKKKSWDAVKRKLVDSCQLQSLDDGRDTTWTWE